VCSIDKECLKKVGDRPTDYDYGADIADYSVVRVLVLLDNTKVIKPFLVLRNLGGSLAAIANVRVVKFWDHPAGAPIPTDRDFSDRGDDDAAGNTHPPTSTYVLRPAGAGGVDFMRSLRASASW
jgi:hypothetical protein